MPWFYETSGGTVKKTHWDQHFSVVHRPRDKKYSVRIDTIANAACNKGLRYSQPSRHQLKKHFENLGFKFNACLKSVQKGKIKGKYVDCSGFCDACAAAAGASIGDDPSAAIIKADYRKYKKLSYENQLRQGTLRKGDIVARNGHAAIIAENMGNVPKDIFANYNADGSKKIVDSKYNEIVKKYLKNGKWKSKLKKKKTLNALRAYLKELKDAYKIIDHKVNVYSNKKQTDSVAKFLRKLKKRRRQLKSAISACKTKIKELKAKQNDKTPEPELNENNENSGNENFIYTYTESDPTADSEPEPDIYDMTWIYAGPTRFITKNEIKTKDYIGDTYCNRSTRINSFTVTNEGYWDIEFDMPFETVFKKSGNIIQIQKKDNNNWRVIPNNSNDIQKSGQYVVGLKTKANTEFVFTIVLTVEDD